MIIAPGEIKKDLPFKSRPIIVLVGPSGAGKSTVARHLSSKEDFSLIVSLTTRLPRPSDPVGEYQYISRFKMLYLHLSRQLLWKIKFAGNHYATSKKSVRQALNKTNHYSLMILVPSVLETLYKFTNKRAIFFFFDVPEDILLRRLKERGDSKKKIEQVLEETKKWRLVVRNSSLPLIKIKNKRTPQHTAAQIIAILSSV